MTTFAIIFIVILILTIFSFLYFHNKKDADSECIVEDLFYCKDDNLDYYLNYIKSKIKLIKEKPFYNQMVKNRELNKISTQEIYEFETKWNINLPLEFKIFIQEIGFFLPYNSEFDDHYFMSELEVSSEDIDNKNIIGNELYKEITNDKYVIIAFANCGICCYDIIMSLNSRHFGQIFELGEDNLRNIESNYINWHLKHINSFILNKMIC